MRRFNLLVFVCLFLLLAISQARAATSAVHIDWQRGQTVYAAQSLTSAGASVASSPAPSLDAAGTLGGTAVVIATQGASIVVVAHANPVATQTNGVYIAPGMPALQLPVQPGDEVAIIAATDQPAAAAGGGNSAASATGSAVPANADYTGLNFGGVLKGWVGDVNGYGAVNIMNTPTVNLGGSLPGFASTPSFNLGTLNGAATAANQTSVQAAPGSSASSAAGVQGVTGGLPVGTGGYEFQPSVIPTVQNAAYAAGQAAGGLQTISIGSTNGLSGILTQVQLASKGGSAVAYVVYVWSKNPSGTTCTDKANFVASQSDNQYLVVAPQSITLALILSAQDTTTYGAAANLVGDFVNGSSNTNLYVCIVANAAVTPATTTDLRLTIQGTKDAP